MLQGIDYYLENFNIFDGIDFSIIYNWLPSDIQASITSIIAVLAVLVVIGLVRKFIPIN